LGRRPKLTAHQRRETIQRRDAGEPVREIALLPLMEPITCDTAYSGGIEIIIGNKSPTRPGKWMLDKSSDRQAMSSASHWIIS
jgi:hypothetical protein